MRDDVHRHISDVGDYFRDAVRAAAPSGWDVACPGIQSLVSYRLEKAGRAAEAGLTVALLEKGYLTYAQFKPSAAHSRHTVDQFATALHDALVAYHDPGVSAPPTRHRSFRRLTAE